MPLGLKVIWAWLRHPIQRLRALQSRRSLDIIVPQAAANTNTRGEVRSRALAHLKSGRPEVFNEWRAQHGYRPLWLANADLRGLDLSGMDLRRCILAGADLRGARLGQCRLDGAILKDARVEGGQIPENEVLAQNLDDLAIDEEAEQFLKWFRQADRRALENMISVSQPDHHIKKKGNTLLVMVRVRNNIRQPLTVALWVGDGQRSSHLETLTLGNRETRALKLKIMNEQVDFKKQLSLTAHLTGDGHLISLRSFTLLGWPRPF